ncbi:ompA family protein [Asticcacaulis biprosthecium C19]|uniref:OmpA family protein n=1 Tax=Asticcacaulis biprosthecium C19 TaxID=715226 RepID=F4QIM0_9CAUL|nr:outer membrane beta-barrel protein [Asticcacaulis biprosthecium]EGF93009.1 ompA family protein [Asticcacaulis biprosthecium C19]
MYKVLLSAAVAACALVCASQASADEAAAATPGNITVEVGLTRANVADIDTSYAVLTARVGTKFNAYFGAEFEAGIGLNEDTVDFGGFDIDTKLEYAIGAFLTGEMPIDDQLALTGRVGYAKTQIKASAGGYSESASGDGAAFGVGVKYTSTSGNYVVRGDVSRYQIDDGDVDAVSVTIGRKF